MRLLFFLFIILFSFQKLAAQQDSTKVKKEKNYSLAAYPLAFYLPETRLGFGGAGIFAFRFKGEPKTSRPSQMQLGFAYTLNKQVLFYLPYQLFWKDQNWLAKGEVGYYRYFFNFYGVGNDQPADFVEEYEVYFPRIRVNVQRLVRPNLYTGLRYWFDDFDIRKVADEGQLVQENITGWNGGKISGLGSITTYDTRDNIFTPTKGLLVEAVAFFNKPALGSDFDYNRYTLDASTYLKTSWDHVFAFNLYTGFITGDAPFNELLLIGGTKKGRGFYEGRFRDKSIALLQAEYRFPLFWRLGGVVFGSVGGVAENYESMSAEHLRPNIGTGIRLLISEEEGINVRVDVGFGKNSIGYYLTIGEAF